MRRLRIGFSRRDFLRTSALAGAGLAGISLAGCTTTTAPPTTTAATTGATTTAATTAVTTTRGPTAANLGYMQIGDDASHFVAEAKGFYAAEKLTVTATAFKGGAEIAAAVTGGSLDLGWSNVASIILAKVGGFDYQYIAPGAHQVTGTNSVHRVMVMPGSGITRPRFLAFKTVGVNTINNIQGWAMKKWCKDDGGDYNTINFREFPMPQLVTNLVGGSIDAITPPEPFPTQAQDQGATVLGDCFSSVGGDVLIATWFGSKAWIDNHTDIVEAFTSATLDAIDWMNNPANQTELRSLIVSKAGVAADIASRMVLPKFPNKVPKNTIQPWISLAKELGSIPSTFDAGELIHNICPQ